MRDLALFNTAVDTMLHSSDILAVNTEDVLSRSGAIFDEIPSRLSHVVANHLALKCATCISQYVGVAIPYRSTRAFAFRSTMRNASKFASVELESGCVMHSQ